MRLLFIILMLTSTLLTTSCDDDKDEADPKPTFVFVHGTFAGQYAWHLIKPKLEAKGYQVVTFDLPAHGDDQTPVSQANFELYVKTTVDKINAIPGKVVLVGHSGGGMVITAAAERIPAKIEKLVYMCAFLPKSDQTLYELAISDTASLLGRSLQPSQDGLTASLPEDVLIQVFAVDASEEIQKVVAKTRPEPLAIFQGKATLTAANFGKIPKYYIKTLKDEGITPATQQKMIDANGSVVKTYTMNTSHSPYWAQPDELVTILQEIN
ncbi:alpha/beta fold hydrolase [Xanthocytophaga agilis]|uniref:Alpha/beta fold hydrolase n=1 Tax=Xanthocytophaga agilis TaxID=3048010 RepID=A0AAE3UIM2_9BACT|nr:alpha/beta fold hydrolase [Xanthocytophaga agilis]MDJ1506775.1 alpha/beta fold hydrolase [Xanthocytophaga agilis]